MTKFADDGWIVHIEFIKTSRAVDYVWIFLLIELIDCYEFVYYY